MNTKKRILKICIGLLVLGYSAPAQDTSATQKKIRLVAEAVLKDATFQFVDQTNGMRYVFPKDAPADAKLRPESPYTDWRYWNGVLNNALMKLGDVLKEPRYSRFPQKFFEFAFDHYQYFEDRYKNEGKWNYPFGELFIMEELDDYGAVGSSLVTVYQTDPQDRYKTYINNAAKYIRLKQNRLKDGTFVRSFPQKWTLWADDLYMSVSFLSRLWEVSQDKKYLDDAILQVVNFHRYLFDVQKGLMYHCWFSDVNQNGVAFWGRANGWALLAQADLLDRIPENHPRRKELILLFQRHVLGLARYQGPDGLWHQLLDKPDSYLETSCTAMFTYAIASAINEGYLESRYASIAQRGWEGVMSKIRDDGTVEGVCTGTGVGDDLVFYYHRPTPHNDVHGIGAVILAGTEVMRLNTK
jgi:rhamnogalacturonyl hydrolase YesR